LFVAAFQARILPDEYYNDRNWLPFLGFLKLNIIPSDEDILEMAKIFSQNFERKLIDAKKLQDLSGKLLRQLAINKKWRKGDSNIVARLRQIKFLPSYFLVSPNSIHLKVFNRINQEGNICIDGAFHKDHIDFVWITNAILPDYQIWTTGIQFNSL